MGSCLLYCDQPTHTTTTLYFANGPQHLSLWFGDCEALISMENVWIGELRFKQTRHIHFINQPSEVLVNSLCYCWPEPGKLFFPLVSSLCAKLSYLDWDLVCYLSHTLFTVSSPQSHGKEHVTMQLQVSFADKAAHFSTWIVNVKEPSGESSLAPWSSCVTH